MLWLEDSQFRPDGSRLQKFYYYSDASTGRKDLLQVSHRIYENDDQNDFVEYPVAYFTDSYYGRPKGLRYPGGTSLAYQFNENGFITEESDPTSSVIYRSVTGRNSRGQVETANIANHTGSYQYQYTAQYYAETGQVQSIEVTNGGSTLQNLSYLYDHFGNLES